MDTTVSMNTTVPDELMLTESLLIFSDVHLGSDLNDCTENVARRSESIDRDLCQLLSHYRREKPVGDRWRIVIAGDFIDFIGMSIALGTAELATELTPEEIEHGVGNASDHARLKLRRVGARHENVFQELARFVADGNALTLVHGNHDLELHWDEVKEDFRAMLLVHAQAHRGDIDATAFAERIEFSPWFFYREGVAYIEHGHQYDPFCSTEHVMAPLSPLDPRRIARGLSDVLLRYVVRPTIGMKAHGHEGAGLLFYLRFAVKLGITGLFVLGTRFAMAVVELFRLRRAHLSEAARALHAEHERRIALLSLATRIGMDRLRALLKLQEAPITRSIRGIMASVLLDRLALALVAMIALVIVSVIGAFRGHALYGVLAVPVAWALFHRHLSKQRNVDPAEQLALRAPLLAKLFPAAFVVMGHTHIPVQAPAGDATYVNLGSWAEDVEDGNSLHATRTHLVIHVRGDLPEAQLFAWKPEGPRRYTPES